MPVPFQVKTGAFQAFLPGIGLVGMKDGAQRVRHPAVRPSTINRSIVMCRKTPTTLSPAHSTQERLGRASARDMLGGLEPMAAQGFAL